MAGLRRPRTRLRALALAVVAVAAVVLGAALPGRPTPAEEPSPAASALPRSVRPAFVPGAPAPLGSTRHLARWAPVLHPVLARAAPRTAAAPVAGLDTRTPEGPRTSSPSSGAGRTARGGVWVRVRLPVLPNGTTGWVPRAALGGYGTVATRLDVDLRRLRATLYRAGRPVFRADVGVGRPQWPTPRGTFYVRNKLTRYRSPAYGPVAFGTSARSPTRRTGRPAASSGSTARTGPTCCPGGSRTAASGSATRTSSCSRGSCPSARRWSSTEPQRAGATASPSSSRPRARCRRLTGAGRC